MRTACNRNCSAIWGCSMSIYQWDTMMFKKNPANYFVLCINTELARMQGVEPIDVHVECIVDDFGNLVRVQ